MSDYQDLNAATQALADPTTSAQDLASIAQQHSSLHPSIATHPAAYDGLLDWLVSQGDPVTINNVWQRRQGVAPRLAADLPDAETMLFAGRSPVSAATAPNELRGPTTQTAPGAFSPPSGSVAAQYNADLPQGVSVPAHNPFAPPETTVPATGFAPPNTFAPTNIFEPPGGNFPPDAAGAINSQFPQNGNAQPDYQQQIVENPKKNTTQAIVGAVAGIAAALVLGLGLLGVPGTSFNGLLHRDNQSAYVLYPEGDAGESTDSEDFAPLDAPETTAPAQVATQEKVVTPEPTVPEPVETITQAPVVTPTPPPAPAAPPPPPPVQNVTRFTDRSVNIRSGPGTNFGVVVAVGEGTQVTVHTEEYGWSSELGRDVPWSEITTARGTHGWVRSDFLR